MRLRGHRRRNQPGVKILGLLQPANYGRTVREVGLLVLPSLDDPWRVVIHDAPAAELPILCSGACGGGVEVVEEGLNGFAFEPGDVKGLANILIYCTSGDIGLRKIGLQSFKLVGRYAPSASPDYLALAVRPQFGRVLVPRAEQTGD